MPELTILNDDDGKYIGEYKTASQEDVDYVLSQPIVFSDFGNEGRSRWKWLRLSNGDLMLGVFPLGDTYMEMADKNNI